MLLFLAAWVLLHRGFYADVTITDLPVYEGYGRRIAAGEVPYRDFRPEYPPLALPVFALPAIADGETGYRVVFETAMAAFGALALLVLGLALAVVRAPRRRLALALGFAALAPLALGNVILSRFDLWPALVTAAAVAALVGSRDRLGAGLLGAGFAVKVFPAVLLPLAVAWTWRRRGRREGLACLGVASGVALVFFLPFLLVAPEGVAASFGRQLSRPLQIESLGSALALAAHDVLGFGVRMQASHGSQNIAGTTGVVVGVLASLVQAGALLWVWTRFARGRPTSERLLRHAAAACVAFVAFGKVLSPQFLIWLIPLVALVGGRRGLLAGTLLAVSLVLTQLWFPGRYWDWALSLEGGVTWLVLARDLMLVGLLAVLVLEGPLPDRDP